MITFSNPRLRAEFEDWPSGRDRVKCVFEIERDPKKGWRVGRTTTNRLGAWCKTKWSTYSGQAAIVDGSDGKTYILQHTANYGFIKIMRHDFLDAGNEVARENNAGASVFESNEPALHAELLKIILQGGGIVKQLTGS